jgi:hypothetical protein
LIPTRHDDVIRIDAGTLHGVRMLARLRNPFRIGELAAAEAGVEAVCRSTFATLCDGAAIAPASATFGAPGRSNADRPS